MTEPRTSWRALRESRAIEPIDEQLATFVLRRAALAGGDAAAHDLLARSAALVSRERARGHSCVFLADWAGLPLDVDSAAPRTAPFPPVAAWREQLRASPLVGDGSAPTPLVLAGDRLYLFRFHAAERRVGARLRERGSAPTGAPHRAGVERWFPDPAETFADGVDWQAVAACAAWSRRLAVILGGPGTGKTTTVARLLAMLVAAAPQTRIALAAPTGKAAARLTDSVRSQLELLELPAPARAALAAVEASTLHRLLGFLPTAGVFRHHRRRPLPADVIVVDEASMVDLELMDALLDAAPPAARLVLLGDPDQLASVATGHVLGDLLTAADPDRGVGPHLAAVVAASTGRAMPGACDDDVALADAVVRLRHTWRFGGGIRDLAAAVRAGDADAAATVLADPVRNDVRAAPAFDPATAARSLAPLDGWLRAVTTAASPEACLRALADTQILCAVREGPQGVASLGAAIDARLRTLGLPSPATDGPYHRGRPLLVTANDHAARLYNGDVGVCWSAPGEASRAWFPGEDREAPRAVGIGRLPPHEPAWAITVHKSQGSEYGSVLLVLPERDSPVATRELVYTGVTRARRDVTLLASEGALRRAIGRRTRRVSGLVEVLRGAGDDHRLM
ncbi:MAG: exodeoxyribonuclease V subunit alpha [Planctomycetes bacterium]|nr:exodeoxyribonuclease V subunit alpha [Planctomycetota bacterium]